MKKIITAATFIALSFTGFSQENYTIKMTMKMQGIHIAGMSGEQEITTYIKGEKTRNDVSSDMMSSVDVSDGKTVINLTDFMGNKTGYTATPEELSIIDKSEKKVEYTAEKKTIAGYECKKAVIISIDKYQKEHKTTVWLTEKIKANVKNKSFGSYRFGDVNLKGFPLEVQTEGGIKTTIVVSEVSTKLIDDSMFKLNTEGYKMTPYSSLRPMTIDENSHTH
ncbi:MAG: hypothetical protein KF900_04485 [Bacteroidetes bacterium]|nr:hypothetical protein [Bacteroidota bacterium]